MNKIKFVYNIIPKYTAYTYNEVIIMENITNLIQSVGFPITVAIALGYMCYKNYNNLNKRYNDLVDKLINKK